MSQRARVNEAARQDFYINFVRSSEKRRAVRIPLISRSNRSLSAPGKASRVRLALAFETRTSIVYLFVRGFVSVLMGRCL